MKKWSALRIDSEDPARIAELAKGKARHVLDVRTLMWQMGYFPTDWAHYRVWSPYSAGLPRWSKACPGNPRADGSSPARPVSRAGAR